MDKRKEAMLLLEETLNELDKPKGAVSSAVQKLYRAATLTDKTDIGIWCAIQLGDSQYVGPLKKFLDYVNAELDKSGKSDKPGHVNLEGAKDILKGMADVKLKLDFHASAEEVNIKRNECSGGYQSIVFIEEKYADLVRSKRGNDDTYYKNNLAQHIGYIKRKTHHFASDLLNEFKFSGTIGNCFDVLKKAVDDRLLDLNPTLAEQLMLAFKAISSPNQEEWSQALTTCRRLLEGLADVLYPASESEAKGRPLRQGQFVNRLWAFMDQAIQSDSNKDLAKAHVDFLGSWMEKTNKLTNKGVHNEVTQLEAVKAVFHVYLVVADILEYMDAKPKSVTKPNINTATMDELEALLGVNRNVAKEVVKARVNLGSLDIDALSKVPGIGPKSVEKAKEAFLFDE